MVCASHMVVIILPSSCLIMSPSSSRNSPVTLNCLKNKLQIPHSVTQVLPNLVPVYLTSKHYANPPKRLPLGPLMLLALVPGTYPDSAFLECLPTPNLAYPLRTCSSNSFLLKLSWQIQARVICFLPTTQLFAGKYQPTSTGNSLSIGMRKIQI